MGLNLSVNILTSGFLVTVIIFLVLMGILFVSASSKMGEVLLAQDTQNNDLELLDEAFNAIKVAYILAFISAGVSILLSVLYAGHETVINPSEYWHAALFLITYILWIVSVVYAYIALDKLYDLRIKDRNGADAYIWAGFVVAIFAFIGLTVTGSGRLGMNIARSGATERLNRVEANINSHLPAIRSQVDTHLQPIRNQVEAHLPEVHGKVNELHSATVAPAKVVTVSSTPSVPLMSAPSPLSSGLPTLTVSGAGSTTGTKLTVRCPDATQ